MNYQLIGNLDVVGSEIGIILPTYREADNISKLIEDIEDLKLNASILVIDDSSPDETAKIVQEKQSKYNNILLCIRPKKSGLGTAITDGFKFFLSSKQHQNMSLQWMLTTPITLKLSHSSYQACIKLIAE